LEYAQLHGDESAAYVSQIKSAGIGVFKVFRIDAQFDWDKTTAYADADFFLFDTPTAGYGGSGKKFDWRVLENYRDKKPFILSGGIGIEEIP
jgi:phosphoribosylanthranilate isomerase